MKFIPHFYLKYDSKDRHVINFFVFYYNSSVHFKNEYEYSFWLTKWRDIKNPLIR